MHCKYFACKECKDEVNQNGYLNKHQYLKSQNCFRDGNPKKTKPLISEVDKKLEKVREARMKGYEGDPCSECGNFTLVRNGTCLKCDTCGSTSGCS